MKHEKITVPTGATRAYSALEIKSVDAERRVIKGTATTPTPDRMSDVVEPLGVEFKNPLVLLHQHDHRSPIGIVRFDKPTAKGITFTAEIAKVDEPGLLKDRVDLAWGEVKAGLVRAVSIGFRPLEMNFMDEGGIRFVRSEVIELSLVSIPANADATITEIRSIDTELRAASGHAVPKATPAASGKRVVRLRDARAHKPFVIVKVNPERAG